jgi:hypothetical protein
VMQLSLSNQEADRECLAWSVASHTGASGISATGRKTAYS